MIALDLLTNSSAAAGHGPSTIGLLFYIFLTLGIMFLLMFLAKPGVRPGVFRGALANCFEQLYHFIENICVGVIGAHGRKYVPMIMTLWMIIFTSNALSLFFPTAPTAVLSFNFALALLAVGYVQYEGIRTNGVAGHLSHFAGPKLPPALILVTLLIFLIEIVSEVMKNFSLSLRIWGNIDGGHQAVIAMNKLGESINVPLGSLLMPLKLITVVVQALIYCLLTCIYLSFATHHAGDDGDHAHSPASSELAADH